MNRKEFLVLVGLFIFTLTGIPSLLKSIKKSINPQVKVDEGFGSQDYEP